MENLASKSRFTCPRSRNRILHANCNSFSLSFPSLILPSRSFLLVLIDEPCKLFLFISLQLSLLSFILIDFYRFTFYDILWARTLLEYFIYFTRGSLFSLSDFSSSLLYVAEIRCLKRNDVSMVFRSERWKVGCSSAECSQSRVALPTRLAAFTLKVKVFCICTFVPCFFCTLFFFAFRGTTGFTGASVQSESFVSFIALYWLCSLTCSISFGHVCLQLMFLYCPKGLRK